MTKNFRARIAQMEDGRYIVSPVKEGSKGALYQTIASTAHCKLQRTRTKYRVVFEISSAEPAEYIGRCLSEEANQIVSQIISSK